MKTEASIITSAQLLSPEEIVFPYSRNGKTGVYKINIVTSVLREVVSPRIGLIHNLCLSSDGKQLFCISSSTANNKYEYFISLINVENYQYNELIKLNVPIVNLAVSPINGRFYFTTAGEVGRSSPLVKEKLRIMNIMSTSNGMDIRKEVDLNAYAIGNTLFFDKNGRFLYFNMLLSATKNINGPYMHDLQSHKSVYLAPKNMFMLHKIKKSSDFVNYYIDFLSPYPDSDNGSCILMGTYDIYKLDINSLDAKFLFSQSDKARKSHYLIRSTAMPFHNGDVIFFKNNERFGSFVILKNKGGQIEVPLIMDPFLKNYQ